MKFIRGVVHSALVGTPRECEAVRRVLSIDNKESFLHENILYTGLIDFVRSQLNGRFPIEIEDTFEMEHPSIWDINIPHDYLKFDDGKQLRDYQIITAKKGIARGRGVAEIATGGGKTEIMAVMIKYLLENGLATQVFVICETRFLMKQTANRFEARGLQGVKRLGGGHSYQEGPIQVCVVDTLDSALTNEDQEVCFAYANCDALFFDECHHVAAKSWVRVGELCPAKYRFGFTATVWSDPFKFSYRDFKLLGLTGGVFVHIPSKVLRNMKVLAEPFVTMFDIKDPPVESTLWRDYYRAGIIQHSSRNSVALSIARSLYEGNYKTLIFVKEINHGLRMTRILSELGLRHAYFVKGGEMMYTWLPSGRWDCKRTSIEELAEIVNTNEQVVVIGNVVMDEGIDVPSFNALIMCTAMKKYRRTVQRAGRGMRAKEGDNSVYIFDFMDATHPGLLEHSNYRLETYKLEEYEFSQSLEHTCERMGIPILIENDIYAYQEEIERPKKEKPERLKRRKRRKRIPWWAHSS